MKSSSSVFAMAALLLGLFFSSPAFGDFTTFTDRAQWEAAVGVANIQVEDFDSSEGVAFHTNPASFNGFTLFGSSGFDNINYIQTVILMRPSLRLQ